MLQFPPVAGEIVGICAKLIRAGDDTRKSRFHTPRGVFCFNMLDMSFAGLTTILRLITNDGVLFPLLWFALPATRFLKSRVKNKSVFEYGSGMSTIWFAKHAKVVYSVEHKKNWYQRMSSVAEKYENMNIMFADSAESYSRALDRMNIDNIDVVLIDGDDRVSCYEHALNKLNEGGVMIVDDTNDKIVARIIADLGNYFKDPHYAAE